MQVTKPQHHLSVNVPPRLIYNKQIDNRWNQLKMHHSFSPRSNFGFTAQGDIGYLYGGYSIDEGKMDDLYRTKFDGNDHRTWQKLPQQGKEKPGKLRSLTLISYRYFLICVGGQKSMLENNNKIYIYNLKNNKWDIAKIKPKGENKVKVQQYIMRDSHNCFIIDSTMYIFGGYQIHSGLYLNSIIKFDLQLLEKSNQLIVQPVEVKGESPSPRGNSGGCLIRDKYYIFGGTDSHMNFRDFWVYDCKSNSWEQIKRQNQNEYWPEERKGAVLGYHEDTGNIFMFGGLKTITKQQNDISIFLCSKRKWIRIHSTTNNLYEPSPTMKKQIEDSPTILQSKNKKILNQEFKLGVKAVDHTDSKLSTQNNFRNKACKTQVSLNNNRYDDKGYETKMDFKKKPSVVQQKKHKDFLLRKKKLLLQITKGYSATTKRELSPVSESLNYSVNQIGDQEHSKSVQNQEEEEHKPRPKVIFDAGRDIVIGKKPCARDGHSGFVDKQWFYIIGGDRHNVSFNDVYVFRMDKGIESVPYYSN